MSVNSVQVEVLDEKGLAELQELRKNGVWQLERAAGSIVYVGSYDDCLYKKEQAEFISGESGIYKVVPRQSTDTADLYLSRKKLIKVSLPAKMPAKIVPKMSEPYPVTDPVFGEPYSYKDTSAKTRVKEYLEKLKSKND